jgi:hypothetical protein
MIESYFGQRARIAAATAGAASALLTWNLPAVAAASVANGWLVPVNTMAFTPAHTTP